MNKIITIFGSSRPRPGDSEYERAYELGRLLAEKGFIVLNGGYQGVMDASLKGAKEAGGKTIGVTVKGLEYVPHSSSIVKKIEAEDIFSRISIMMEKGDAFIILKGGTGTLLELGAVWEFVNKKFISKKPIIIADCFWTGIVDTFADEISLGEFFSNNGTRIPSTSFVEIIEDNISIVEHLCEYLN